MSEPAKDATEKLLKETKVQDPKATETKDLADLFSKFSAKDRAPVELGGDVDNEPNKEVIKQQTEDAEENEAKRQEEREEAGKQREVAKEKRKAGSNVPHIIEEKRKAERERDELRQKIDDFDKNVKPTLEKQIADLQTKVDSGELSAKKESEYTDKITQLESRLDSREKELVTENQNLKKRLEFHNLAESDRFQEEYVRPVEKSFMKAMEVLAGDRLKIQTFQRALAMNAEALRAPTNEDRIRLENERDSLVDSVVGDLTQFRGGRFIEAVTEYFDGSKTHAEALRNHEKTTSEIRKRASEERDRAVADRYRTWDTTYDRTETKYKDDVTLSDDDKKIAEELGHDVEGDIKKSNHLAKRTIAGDTQVTDAIDMVHRGRVYPALKTKIAVLEHKISQRDELIAKLRGNSTLGGDEEKREQKDKNAPAKDLEAFYDKFRPGR